MFYILTIFTSLFNLILTISIMFCDEESNLHMFYGDTESQILTIVSAILLMIGLVCDKINDYKTR